MTVLTCEGNTQRGRGGSNDHKMGMKLGVARSKATFSRPSSTHCSPWPNTQSVTADMKGVAVRQGTALLAMGDPPHHYGTALTQQIRDTRTHLKGVAVRQGTALIAMGAPPHRYGTALTQQIRGTREHILRGKQNRKEKSFRDKRNLFRMASSGMLRRVALVRTDVSEELSASIIRVTRIGELGTLAVTSNRRSVRRLKWTPIGF
jgi:hypothetical protein